MIRLGKFSTLTFLTAVLAGPFPAPAATNSAPDFKEVYELIRANLAGSSDAELNRAAVYSLLKELSPKASLVTSGEAVHSTLATHLVSRSFVFDGEIAYLRVARVSEGLTTELRNTYQQLAASNKLTGGVLDLRFASGSDYPAAVAAAELFSLKKPATLDWGAGSQETKSAAELITIPLTVLVNGETRVAAETLAAMLREAGAGLILGNRSAGEALLTKDFNLSSGAVLRVATGSVKLNGAELSSVRPDIEVSLSPREEKVFYNADFFAATKTNTFGSATKTAGTNAAVRRPRLTEAELVRAHKQGLNPDDEEDALTKSPRENRAENPVVSDPVLGRALDLLKGLAIVRQPHP